MSLKKQRSVRERSNGKDKFELMEITSSEFFDKHIIVETDSEDAKKCKFDSVSFPSGVMVLADRKPLFLQDGELLFSHFDMPDEDKKADIATAELPESFIKTIRNKSEYLTRTSGYGEWGATDLEKKADSLLQELKENSVIIAADAAANADFRVLIV